MPFSYRQLFFGGNTFCCCLPVRLGVIAMSTLGCLIAGLLAVILWFEISSTDHMTTAERAAFVLAALTETILFAASILGLVGAIVRKQSFTQIYAYILYFHFFLNVVVVAYLTYEVTHTSQNAETVGCLAAIKDPQAQAQCTGFLSFARWVYISIASTVLLVEMYGSIIIARYVNQLQREKRAARASRVDTERAFQLKPRNDHQYSLIPDPASQIILPILDPSYLGPSNIEFNPYEEDMHLYTEGHVPVIEGITDNELPPPIEIGYGGGSWTHDGIVEEEKEKLKIRDQREQEVATESVMVEERTEGYRMARS